LVFDANTDPTGEFAFCDERIAAAALFSKSVLPPVP
jgi:hypothetical protein